MKHSVIVAVAGASLAVALVSSAAPAIGRSVPHVAAAGARPAAAVTASVTVSVRIEGATRTLLAARKVTTAGGSVTKGGAPSGACPADTAAGALNAATHGDWAGKWYPSYSDYLIDSILGETPNAKTAYWGVWVNDRFASAGACALTLKPGEQLLFAVDPLKHNAEPLAITAPATATAGHPFTVTIVAYDAAGHAAPLASRHVTIDGRTFLTSRTGRLALTSPHAGSLILTASAAGYIRAADVTVKVAA